MKHTIALSTCAVIMILTSAAESDIALEQKTQSFTIALKGSVAEVTPLFGPVREAEWAPTWAPRFIHPADAQQREGAIFTAPSADGRQRLWLLTAYQPEQGRIEYVVLVPGFTANQIKNGVLPD